jgi:hypothetical protein
MNLRDVGSERSVNDSVQTNTMINKRLKCSTTTPKKKMLKYNKNNCKSVQNRSATIDNSVQSEITT